MRKNDKMCKMVKYVIIVAVLLLALPGCSGNNDAEIVVSEETTMNEKLVQNIIDTLQCDQFDAQDIVDMLMRYIPDNIEQITIETIVEPRTITINSKYCAKINKKNHVFAIFDMEENNYIYAEYE